MMDRKLIIPVTADKRPTFKASLRKFFLIDKLNSPLGYAFIFLVTALAGIGVGMFGIKFGVMIIAALIGLPSVYAIVFYPRVGILLFLTMAYLIMYIMKLGIDFPLGTLMDGMEALFILSIYIDQKKNKRKDWSIFKGPLTTIILIWMAFNFLEAVNPAAASQMAWLYTVRTVAIVMLTYFIFIYYINSKEYIRIIFKLWIALALFAAAYAYKQEHIGFTGFENEFLNSDPNIAMLLFIGGVWRKFSIFSDPVAFAYNMVTVTMLCIGLMFGPISKLKKRILGVCVFCFLTVMLYSGTRGAYVLIPAALLLLAILRYNRWVLLWVALGAAAFAVLIFIPTSNQTLYRFQTAFKPSDDASFNVRKINQKRIQPYIQTHPIGGGLGATGVWGWRFAPTSYLANFPPDSGYVRVAVEMGWLGLFIFCIFMFMVLYMGIDNYYKIRDPELKSYCLASVLIVFALNIGNYPQEALVQYPSNIYFYLVAAMITVTKRLDDQQNALMHVG